MDHSETFGNWNSTCEEILCKNFPIHRACRDGDVQHLTALLAAGEIDQVYDEDDFYGWTPMHWAAYFGKLPCLVKIREHGACCDFPTERFCQTAAHIAAYSGHSHCLKWLLHTGSLINRQLACLRRLINMLDVSGVRGSDVVSGRFSQTPSHLCAYANHPQCLYWLVQSKSDINAQDYLGEAPIHKAAHTGSMECISLLVSQGTKLSLRNTAGNTASQVAVSAGYIECANYLERALQAQTQATPVFDELRKPVTQPTSNGTTPLVNPLACDQNAMEDHANVHNTFISTNTYHSHPHFTGNSSISSQGDNTANPSMTNGVHNNNNNQIDDCDMEMDDGCHGGDVAFSGACNGNSVALGMCNGNGVTSVGCNGDGVGHNGDVLLNDGVTRNLVPLAGRKRSREDIDDEPYKRARNGNDDYIFEQSTRQIFTHLPFMSDDVLTMEVNEDTAMVALVTNGYSKPVSGHAPVSGHVERSMDIPKSSCLRFKEPPPQMGNFMSHLV